MSIVRAALILVVIALGLVIPQPVAAGHIPGSVHRLGIIHISGEHHLVVDGLRQGLRDLGLEEGKHVVLDIRETTYARPRR